jgi:DNA replication protein DnaC
MDGLVRRVRRCTQCSYLDRRRGTAPGIPADEHGSTFDNYEATKDNVEAVRQAQFFVDGVHPGLYLWGGLGSGKTRLACTVLNTLWKTGIGCRFFRVPELLQRLMPGSDSTDDAFDQAVDVPVLCLDDVGANAGTDFSRRMLQTIFDARLDRGHRTIWTSNLDLDELADFLMEDGRLPSRIAGNAKVVELDGPDWRLKQAKRRAVATT